jgi:hypothetical protein
MRRHGWSAVTGAMAAVVLLAYGSGARAQSVTTERQTVNPAPAPAPVVAQPVVAQPVQAAPAAPAAQAPATSSKETRTVSEERDQGSFMGTVAKDTLYGALTGVIVGGAIYFISGQDTRPVTVAYWGAGGALFGAGVGLVEVMIRQNRHEEAISFMDRKVAHVGGMAFVPTLVNARF